MVLAGVAALLVVVALVTPTLVGDVGAAGAQDAPGVDAGEVVAAVQDAGTVVAVGSDGEVRTLVSGLSQPRAVEVLQDGSLIVAEAGANRLVGIGGRYGPTPTPVVDYPFPGGLHQAADGSIYVTSFSEGKLSVVDLDAGTVIDLATGLQTPGGLVVRNGTAYVAELNGQRVVAVDRSGRVTTIAEGFQAPLGVSGGPGAALYVADYGGNEVVRIENGERTVVAGVPGPRGITSDPVAPRGDESFRLVVSIETGVVEIDPVSGSVGEPASALGAVGVAVVRPAPAVEPSTSVGAGGGTAPPGTSPVAGSSRAQEGEPSGSPTPVVVLAVVIFLAVGGFLVVQLRRAHAPDEDDGGQVERLDEATLHEAFGPCVTQELEAERAQAALDAVLLQIELLRRRVEEGELEAEAARLRLAEARSAREQALAARQATAGSGEGEEPAPHPIHEAELDLTTADGHAALAAYRSGELGPVELARRWAELGEEEAIARVRDAGERARQVDPTVPGPDERLARADLVEAQADVDHATVDLTRMATREQECRAELVTAIEALTACRDRHTGVGGDGLHDPDQAAAWGSEPPAAASSPEAGRSDEGGAPEAAATEAAATDDGAPAVAVTDDGSTGDGSDEPDGPGTDGRRSASSPIDPAGGLPTWQPPAD